ncbi:MAG: type II toxin-antitoxin system VapC family toxin [Burkholderiales bacterium]|jgi:predicted nucleic-acid-binding protein|nr:type II toxin-antitoxin system VapC family toxin [Burkholderiales bacterium]
MIALDTNLLARLLLRDDAAQHARVKALLQTEQVFTAPVTVLLELVWVLEANDCTPPEIEHGMQLLLGLRNFRPPQADAVRAALRAYAQGVDFADALHLALSAGDDAFMSFDKAFARKAAKLGATPRVVPA